MKRFIAALLISGICFLSWVYIKHPDEWDIWSLRIQKKVAEMTGGDVGAIEESLFSVRKNFLLEKYDTIEEEYKKRKLQIEEEFNEIKVKLEEKNESIEEEVFQFQQKIDEKRRSFEQKKAEIEKEIAEVKQQYEETKSQLQELNDSVQEVRENVGDSVDAIEALRDTIVE